MTQYNELFATGTDYKTAFANAVSALYEAAKAASASGALIPTATRISTVRALTDAYVSQVGERPVVAQLDRLSTFILAGDEAERKMAAQEAKGAKGVSNFLGENTAIER